ncbi:MAG: hypothetical protein DSZ02_02005 [Gammaproteobacteria bacterium]|nr:MAG: hypothetical protein DSZ02_02005 [Gammaproteobacteria bacterium]
MPEGDGMDGSVLFACQRCDALQRVPVPRQGEAAYCTCCGSRLLRRPKGGLDRPIALMTGALILFAVSNLFSLVSLRVSGMEMETTLLGTSVALWHHQSKLVAAVVFVVSFLVPVIVMTSTLYVLVSLRFRLLLPFTRRLLAFLSHLHPWEMGDVFIVSMLVAMVKLIGMARVIVDDGFYALSGAVVLALAAQSGIETWLLWRLLDRETATTVPAMNRQVSGETVS